MTPREVCVEERAAAKARTRATTRTAARPRSRSRSSRRRDQAHHGPRDLEPQGPRLAAGLLALVSKRRRLINYLHSRDAARPRS